MLCDRLMKYSFSLGGGGLTEGLLDLLSRGVLILRGGFSQAPFHIFFFRKEKQTGSGGYIFFEKKNPEKIFFFSFWGGGV